MRSKVKVICIQMCERYNGGCHRRSQGCSGCRWIPRARKNVA